MTKIAGWRRKIYKKHKKMWEYIDGVSFVSIEKISKDRFADVEMVIKDGNKIVKKIISTMQKAMVKANDIMEEIANR